LILASRKAKTSRLINQIAVAVVVMMMMMMMMMMMIVILIIIIIIILKAYCSLELKASRSKVVENDAFGSLSLSAITRIYKFDL